MKNLLKIALFALILTTFYGCPVGLDHSLSEPGKEKIDPALIGVWVNESSDAEVLKVEISKKDDFSYTVKVLEKGEMYTLETDDLTGWITELGGKKFLYFKPEGEEKYYHYMIQDLKKNSMVTCDLSLLDGGIDAVTSTETLRSQTQSSMKMEDFCKETSSWKKE